MSNAGKWTWRDYVWAGFAGLYVVVVLLLTYLCFRPGSETASRHNLDYMFYFGNIVFLIVSQWLRKYLGLEKEKVYVSFPRHDKEDATTPATSRIASPERTGSEKPIIRQELERYVPITQPDGWWLFPFMGFTLEIIALLSVSYVLSLGTTPAISRILLSIIVTVLVVLVVGVLWRLQINLDRPVLQFLAAASRTLDTGVSAPVTITFTLDSPKQILKEIRLAVRREEGAPEYYTVYAAPDALMRKPFKPKDHKHHPVMFYTNSDGASPSVAVLDDGTPLVVAPAQDVHGLSFAGPED